MHKIHSWICFIFLLENQLHCLKCAKKIWLTCRFIIIDILPIFILYILVFDIKKEISFTQKHKKKSDFLKHLSSYLPVEKCACNWIPQLHTPSLYIYRKQLHRREDAVSSYCFRNIAENISQNCITAKQLMINLDNSLKKHFHSQLESIPVVHLQYF